MKKILFLLALSLIGFGNSCSTRKDCARVAKFHLSQSSLSDEEIDIVVLALKDYISSREAAYPDIIALPYHVTNKIRIKMGDVGANISSVQAKDGGLRRWSSLVTIDPLIRRGDLYYINIGFLRGPYEPAHSWGYAVRRDHNGLWKIVERTIVLE